jgi:hypothetical protein
MGDQFVWLYEDTMDWQTISPQATVQPYFIGHESLRSLKHAAMAMRLKDSDIENIYYGNARQMLGVAD